MSDVLTLSEAEDLVARTLALIEVEHPRDGGWVSAASDAAFEQVTSDLAGLRRHLPIELNTPFCSRCTGLAALPWPCEDYTERIDSLRRTARLYGVQP